MIIKKNRMLSATILPCALRVRVGLEYRNNHYFKYIENFTTKNENFQIKNSDIFHISA